jgi:hypothetical protein
MKICVGQRWQYTDYTYKYIVEITDQNQNQNGLYPCIMVQSCVGIYHVNEASLKSSTINNKEYSWTWEYLPGQDKTT